MFIAPSARRTRRALEASEGGRLSRDSPAFRVLGAFLPRPDARNMWFSRPVSLQKRPKARSRPEPSSLSFITGLIGDLASLAKCLAPKGTQASLNQPTLRFR